VVKAKLFRAKSQHLNTTKKQISETVTPHLLRPRDRSLFLESVPIVIDFISVAAYKLR